MIFEFEDSQHMKLEHYIFDVRYLRRRWLNNIKMDLKNRMWVVGWIGLVQDTVEWWALVKTITHLQLHMQPYSI
jgi:hypothetical protein